MCLTLNLFLGSGDRTSDAIRTRQIRILNRGNANFNQRPGRVGSGKSQLARVELEAAEPQTIIVDFQALVVAVLAVERGPDGRFPNRDQATFVLPLVERLRRQAIDAAVAAELGIIATNSDGSQERRAMLIDRMGGVAAGVVERVVDPGIEIVSARLSDPATGILSAKVARKLSKDGTREFMKTEIRYAPLEIRDDPTRQSSGNFARRFDALRRCRAAVQRTL